MKVYIMPDGRKYKFADDKVPEGAREVPACSLYDTCNSIFGGRLATAARNWYKSPPLKESMT